MTMTNDPTAHDRTHTGDDRTHPGHDRTYVGSTVLDRQGEPIGTVKDVVFEETDMTPSWLVVKPGPFRAQHYVPARNSYRTAGDDVVVPYDRDVVRHAPKAPAKEHVISHENRTALLRHYGL